ncbi:MAG TPA: pyridoxal phosphate-dependent aminotransferase [Thermomicrobiales bacterium]|nr:pyridoxal phosphate-dependent aminotransferase [Thermomicrobiales bacterium]
MTTLRTSQDYYAARIRDAMPSPTIAVSEAARALRAQGIDVIDLGGGDPDFITPQHIRDAAVASMNAGETHYVGGTGTPEFRKAISNKLQADNRIVAHHNGEILVTPGGKFALFLAAQAFIEPGVDVMVLEPAWVSYVPIVELAGGNAIQVGLSPNDNFAISREILEAHVTPSTRVLMVNSPNNPTGRVMTREEAEAIASFANAHDLMVWTDEMYEKIIYDRHQHLSLATFPGMIERTLTFNGLSKAYAMTGWRLGYVAGPKPFIAQMAIVNSHATTCATSFAQAGGTAALNGPQNTIQDMVNAWDRRRHLITEGINSLQGLRTNLVEGAFYSFVDAREIDGDSVRLADRILKEVHIGVVPGVAFGECGEGHFRLSFATSDDELNRTIERLGNMFGFR